MGIVTDLEIRCFCLVEEEFHCSLKAQGLEKTGLETGRLFNNELRMERDYLTPLKKKPRVRPTVAQQKALIVEARGNCGWCKVAAPKLEFHHIDGDRSNTVLANLIALCGRCHDGATLQNPSEADLVYRKRELSWMHTAAAFHSSTNAAKEGVTINIQENAGQVAGTINYNIRYGGKPKEKIILPTSIGGDPARYGYMEYLIVRLAEFRNSGKSFGQKRSGKIHPGVIRNQIRNERGSLPKDLPLESWDSLISDLKAKIDNTALGRLQRSRNLGRYHTFEEHIEQMMHGRKNQKK